MSVAGAAPAGRPGLWRGAAGRCARVALATGMAALLAACMSSPLAQRPGTDRSAVLAQLGQPLSATALPNGGERLLYSTLPAGREVYHVDLGQDGRVVRTEQVLTLRHFSALSQGGWTALDVHAFFGPPFEVQRVSSFEGAVWTYRFMDDINLRRMAHVHIDPQGIVRKVMFTDEPLPGDDRVF